MGPNIVLCSTPGMAGAAGEVNPLTTIRCHVLKRP